VIHNRSSSNNRAKKKKKLSLTFLMAIFCDQRFCYRMVGRNWLADSISKAERILDPLLTVLLNSTNAPSITQRRTNADSVSIVPLFISFLFMVMHYFATV
jgi:hypothetical protein